MLLRNVMAECGLPGIRRADAAWFATTQWTTVLAAGRSESSQAAEALEKLCRAYWYPLYCYVRHKGYAPEDAADLTQGFFARFIEKRYLEDVAPEKGKFRTFLLSSLNHHLANEWDRSRRLKRGGGVEFLALDPDDGEARYSQQTQDGVSAEESYDRRWAETMLAKVLAKLRGEFAESGDVARFEVLKPFLLGDPGGEAYEVVAVRLHLSEQGVKSAVHRLRQRFRQLFREEIAQTVATRGAIDEELRYLVRLMTR